jgi:hypothetical protein
MHGPAPKFSISEKAQYVLGELGVNGRIILRIIYFFIIRNFSGAFNERLSYSF